MTVREQILRYVNDVEYVSFDVFDTLIFRMVRKPCNIFEKVYEKNPSLFPNYISAREWREIRQKAESFARQKKCEGEITLEDIYSELPEIITETNNILQNEVYTEIENTFLNPEMRDVLYELYDVYEKKIILVSDMYLSKKVICEILSQNGFRMEIVENVFVSSELGKKKSTGAMYEYILRELRCEPQKILHIGDNLKADYLTACKYGLNAIYYPLISEAIYRYPYLIYEAEEYNEPCHELHAIRLLAAITELNGEEKEWFEIGAMIMGPILVYAAEWVLDIAEQNKINHIFPMMREGKFLSEILERAKNERKWPGKIIPMYISRKALYPALLSVLKEKDIVYGMETHKLRLANLLELFQANDLLESYAEYGNALLCEAKEIYIGKKTLYAEIKEKLCNIERIQQIRKSNQDADGLLWTYFEQLGMDKHDYITFDVGWRGNAQNAIQRIMRKHKVETKGIHLLVNGKKSVITERNLEEGCDIRGYTGNFGFNDRLLYDVNIPIFEMMMMCNLGTTMGYEKKDNSIVPVLKDVKYDEKQIQMMRHVQEGVFAFQKVFYEVVAQKKRKIHQSTSELLAVASRMTAYPTGCEARLIGRMQYDQGFGINEKWQIINPDVLKTYKMLGYTEFIHNKSAREDEWYQGMNASINGMHYYKQLMFHYRIGEAFQCSMFVEKMCREFESFVLVGAGKRIKNIMLFLHMMDAEDRVEKIMDSNQYLQKTKICGKEIVSFYEKTKTSCFVITAISKETVSEITKELIEIKGEGIKILSIF